VCFLVWAVRKYGDYMVLAYVEDDPIKEEGRPGRRPRLGWRMDPKRPGEFQKPGEP